MKTLKSHILAALFCLNIGNLLYAQQVQWASKIIKFSSDLGGKQNGIKRILGRPDVFPQAGASPNAWAPKNALDGREIVIVGFEKPQTVNQIAVFENTNAGSVVKISVDNGSGNFQEVWNRKKDWNIPFYKLSLSQDRTYYFGRKRRKIQEAPESIHPGITHALLEVPQTNVVAVKVEFNFGLVSGIKQIDAIGISDSEIPIDAKINTKREFDNLPESEQMDLSISDVSSPIIMPNGELLLTINGDDGEKIMKLNKSKKIEATKLSVNSSYNYVEFINNQWLIRGGANYAKNTSESGFELLKFENEDFTSLGQIKITAFNNYNETADLTATVDLKNIILALETDFTQGGSDLYFATQKEGIQYGFLQNMGKIINSAAEEVTPQLLSDSKTLLFASNGFSGYGNYDLYVSYRLDDTWKNWSEPINLGNKINSLEAELSPFYDEKNQILYYTQSKQDKLALKSISVNKAIFNH